MIEMFMGEFHHNIDEKSRLTIPTKFRDELGSEFIITRGIERCLYVYPKDKFDKIVEKLNSIPFTKKDAREFIRFFLSGATEVEFDKQGRILIPGVLKSYANITSSCAILGTGERLEIWDDDTWTNVYNSTFESMSDIAESLFDTNL